MAWRTRVGAAGMRTESLRTALHPTAPGAFFDYYERRFVGLDEKARRPVFYQNYQRFVVRDLSKFYPLARLERFHAWEQERAQALCDELARRGANPVGKMAVVLDVGKMTIRRHVNKDFLRVMKTIATLDANHFPERMGVTFILNAPGFFPIVWNMVKGFIDPVTAAKIFVLGEDWRPTVAEKLGAHIVEAIDGGKNMDAEFHTDRPDDAPFVPVEALVNTLLGQGGGGGENADEDDDDDDVFADARSVWIPGEDHDVDLTVEENDDNAGLLVGPGLARRQLSVLDGTEVEGEGWTRRALVVTVACQWVATILVSLFAGLALGDRRWMPRSAMLLALTSLPFGGLALLGAQTRNAPMLYAHLSLQATVTAALGVVAVAALFVAAHPSVGSGVQVRYTRDGRQSSAAYIRVGAGCLAAILTLVPQCLLSRRLAAMHAARDLLLFTLGRHRQLVDGACAAMRMYAHVVALMGLAGLVYSAAAVSYFVRRTIGHMAFAPYMLFQGSLMLLGVALVSRWCSGFHLVLDANRNARVRAAAPAVVNAAVLFAALTAFFFVVALAVATAYIYKLNTREQHRSRNQRKNNARSEVFSVLIVTASFEVVIIAVLLVHLAATRSLADLLIRRDHHDSATRRRRRRQQRGTSLASEALSSSKLLLSSSSDNPGSSPATTSLSTKKRDRRKTMEGDEAEEEKEENHHHRRTDGAAALDASSSSSSSSSSSAAGTLTTGGGDDDDDSETPPSPPLVTGFERLCIAWGLATGTIHIFVDGTFAVFSQVAANQGKEDNRRIFPWFVGLWRAWGAVDARYRSADSFIVCQNAAMAIVGGPACIWFAWATFERKPWRHLLGAVLTIVQLWTLGLYVATEAHRNFRDTKSVDSVVYFWILFVLVTMIRFVLPLPVLLGSTRRIILDSVFKESWDTMITKARITNSFARNNKQLHRDGRPSDHHPDAKEASEPLVPRMTEIPTFRRPWVRHARSISEPPATLRDDDELV